MQPHDLAKMLKAKSKKLAVQPCEKILKDYIKN